MPNTFATQQSFLWSVWLLCIATPLWNTGCSDLPPAPLPAPDGYTGVRSWSVLHDVRTESAPPEAPQILQDPVRIIPSHDGGILIAEKNMWRVRKYAVTFGGTGALFGAPETVASMDPDATEGSHIPATFRARDPSDLFGRLLTTTQDGILLVSGPQGTLWIASPDQSEATRLGRGQEGVILRDGVALREADLSQVVGLSWAPSIEGDLETLLIASNNAIFAAQRLPSEDGALRFAPVRHIVGSGATSESPATTGTNARAANISLNTLTLLGADERTLFFTETSAGIVWAVPNYAQADSVVVRLAGGGSSLNEDDPPLERSLNIEQTNAFQLLPPTREGSTHRVMFFITGVPRHMHISVDEDTPSASSVDIETVLTFRRRENMAAVQIIDQIFLGNRERGTLDAFSGSTEDTVRIAIGAPDHTGRTKVPRFQRPSTVTPYFFEGRDTFAISDLASGALLTRTAEGAMDGLLFATEGRSASADPSGLLSFFNPFSSVAYIPPNAQRDEAQLLTNTLFSLQLYSLEPTPCGDSEELCLNSTRLASNGLSLDPINRLSVTSYFPESPPTLFALSRGTSLYDPENRAFLNITTQAIRQVSPDSSFDSVIQNTTGILPSEERDIGANVLDLRNLNSITTTPETFLITVHVHDPDDLLSPASIVATLIDEQDTFQTLASRPTVNRNTSTLLAGGGTLSVEDGTRALDSSLVGAHAATLTPRGDLLVALHTSTVSTLVRIGSEGTLQTITNPNTSTPLSIESPSPLPLDAFAPPSRVALMRLTCAPQLVIANTSAGVWALNTTSTEHTLPGNAGRVEPDSALRLNASSPHSIACLDGDLVFVFHEDESSVLARHETESTLPLHIHSLIDHPEQTLLVGREDPTQAWRIWSADFTQSPPTLEPLSGQTSSPWEGRTMRNTNIADEMPLWSAHRDGTLYGLLPDALFRLPTEDSGYLSQSTRMRVVWDNAPLGDPVADVQSFAVDPNSSLDTPTVYYAVHGVLYQHILDGQQTPIRIAGGGTQRPASSAKPLDAAFSVIHAIAPGPDGRIWLWWDDQVGFINTVTQSLTAIAGGGTQSPRDATLPWDIQLPSSSIHHPPMALLPNGDLVLADPTRGLLIQLRPF